VHIRWGVLHPVVHALICFSRGHYACRHTYLPHLTEGLRDVLTLVVVRHRTLLVGLSSLPPTNLGADGSYGSPSNESCGIGAVAAGSDAARPAVRHEAAAAMLAAAAARWQPTDRQLSCLYKLFGTDNKVPRGDKALQRIATKLDLLEPLPGRRGTVTSTQVYDWWVDKLSRLLAGQRAASAAGAAGEEVTAVAAGAAGEAVVTLAAGEEVVAGAADAAGATVKQVPAGAALAVGPGRYCPPRRPTHCRLPFLRLHGIT